MKSKEIYQSIDQAKVKKLKGGDKIIANIKRVEKETKGFTVENPKFDVAMTKLYGLLKTKNPEVLKDVKVEEKVTEVKVPTTKAERKKRPAKKTKTVKKTVKKATGKKKNTKPTPTPSAPKTKKVPFSTRAKQLADKEGISFAEARKKLSKQIKDEEAKIEKKVKSDLDKLLAFVRSDKFEDGEKYPKTYGQQSAETSSLSSDAKRKAKPRGKRISKKGAVNQHGVSEGGNVYYEYRDNRSDRNSIKAPQGQYKYKGKTPPYLEAGGTLPTPFGQAGLVGETGAMNEMELFAMGGGLPQGVHQYYANTYNPAYPTPHGYEEGGEVDGRYKVLLEKRDNSGKLYPPNLYWKGNDKNLIAKKVKEAKKDFPARKVFVTDEVGDREIYNFAKGGSIKVGDKVKYPKAKMIGKVKSIKDLGFEKELTIEYDDGKIIKEGESSVIKLAKGGYVDIIKVTEPRSGKRTEKQVSRKDTYREALKEVDRLNAKNKNPDVKFVTGNIFAKGGQIDSVYVDELRFRTGMSKNAIEEIIERNNFSKDNLLNLMVGIDRGFIKPSLVSSAYFGGKTSKENKKLVEFSKSNKAFKMAKGGINKTSNTINKFGLLSFSDIDKVFGVDLFELSENEQEQELDALREEWENMQEDERKSILEDFGYDEEFAKGGELSKEFKFDKNFVIYVPSTSNVGDTISKAELDKRVNEVERFVANKFGGYTETETDGGYKSTTGKIIEEDIVKVSVFAKANDWKKNEKSVISKVRRWAKKWGQEAIGFEYEGDLYYVSDSKIMKNGGVIDAFNLQFIKDVPKTNLKVEKVNNKISYKKGGKIGFDALSKKVAKRYEGKAVPKKYQREYGKRYSKVEAQEVGDKVASKVYRQQLKNK